MTNQLPLNPSYLLDTTPVYEVGEVTSVLDVAWELQQQERLPIFASVLGDSQNAGRGRGGRKWSSPPGHVYAALRLPLNAPFAGTLASLSLALELALALEDLYGLTIKLKWPNDLIYQGGKCGGLLLENRRGALIAGIGLNIDAPPTLLQERDPLAPPPGALPKTTGPPQKLWLEVVQWVFMDYNRRFYEHFANWSELVVEQSQHRLLGLGQVVTIENPSTQPLISGPSLTGNLIGLAPTGALLLEGPSGPVAVWSGTLTLNPGNFSSHYDRF